MFSKPILQAEVENPSSTNNVLASDLTHPTQCQPSTNKVNHFIDNLTGQELEYYIFIFVSNLKSIQMYKKKYKYEILVEKLSVVVHEIRLVGNFAQDSGF